MGLYDILVYLHVLAFVFWLGGDLGVAMLGSAFRDRSQPLSTRLAFLKLLGAVDMGPRTAWVVMVPLSIALVDVGGYWDVPTPLVWLSWALGAVWLALTWAIFLNGQGPLVDVLKRAELAVKLVIAVAYGVLGVMAVAGLGPLPNDWLGLKALTFAVIFGCAIMIDVASRPVTPLLIAVIEQGSTDQTEVPLRRAMDRARYWVWATYALLLVIGYLGSVKPA